MPEPRGQAGCRAAEGHAVRSSAQGSPGKTREAPGSPGTSRDAMQRTGRRPRDTLVKALFNRETPAYPFPPARFP